jgi:hypothetical protein
LPTDPHHRDEITAAVAAYNHISPDAPLRRSAARLLAVMFPAGDECRQTGEALAAEGFSREDLKATLRQLVAAGFLSRGQPRGRTPVAYRLHLPPPPPRHLSGSPGRIDPSTLRCSACASSFASLTS